MSNYTFKARHKKNGNLVFVEVLDDFFAPYEYGYQIKKKGGVYTEAGFNRLYERIEDDPIEAERDRQEKVFGNYTSKVREFDTGANRDTDEGKLDYEGFLSPAVLKRYAEYMHKHRFQSDGQLRDSDNWQKGIPQDAYMKSAWRHFHDWWSEHRGIESKEGKEEAICALIFNAMGYLHEELKDNDHE